MLFRSITGNLDVFKLPTFDLDYIWLKLRSKSIEEIVTIPFECQNKVGDTICGTTVNVPINFDMIEVSKNPENNPKIELQDGIGIIMSYPTFETFQTLNAVLETNDVEKIFNVALECISMIYDASGKTYEREHVDKTEMKEFLEALSELQFLKIVDFFKTLPTMKHQVHFKCPKCKYEVEVTIEGTQNFLEWDSVTKLLGT